MFKISNNEVQGLLKNARSFFKYITVYLTNKEKLSIKFSIHRLRGKPQNIYVRKSSLIMMNMQM